MVKTNKYDDFCIFILTHGNAASISTLNLLNRRGNTYPIKLIVDDEDSQKDQYIKNYGANMVCVFNKQKYYEEVDKFGDFGIRGVILYARNFCFDCAKELGYRYFIELDDDYTNFHFRINDKLKHPRKSLMIQQMDVIFTLFLDYFKNTPFASIAFSQGGDWFGGDTSFNKEPKRKAMNSFFCKTDERVYFKGAFNEDVNIYVADQTKGVLFLTVPHVELNQKTTQISKKKNNDGMGPAYRSWGTYVKSFYSILCAPASVSITSMGQTDRRLHHSINWNVTAPKIIRETYKK